MKIIKFIGSWQETIALLFVISGFIISFTLIVTFMPHKVDVIIYDCSISEISPDIPIEVKNQCRKLNLERFKI